MNFIFLYPEYLLLLFIIPAMILLHFISLKSKGKQVVKFANFEAIARIKGIDLYSKNLIILTISVIIAFSFIMSLSGLTLEMTTNSSSASFVIAIDSSRSMEANDIYPTRIDAAKSIARGFIDSSGPGSRMGIISFSGNSLIEQEITQDKNLASAAVNEIIISEIGGTDINEAVTISVGMLKNEEEKAVIIFSDGQINVGRLDESIDYAKENKVAVHTIAMGKASGGNTSYGVSRLDEETLRALSFNTGGKFVSLENKEDLASRFGDIMNFRIREVSVNLSRYMLLIAVILFVLEYILINTRFKSIP